MISIGSRNLIFLIVLILSFFSISQASSQEKDVIRLGSVTFVGNKTIQSDIIVIEEGAKIAVSPGKKVILIAESELVVMPVASIVSEGVRGVDGQNGANGDNESRNCRDGGHGRSGYPGQNGTEAGEVIIVCKYIDIKQEFVVKLIGGSGGNGGHGGNGGYAGRASAACTGGCNAGRGGNGGNGGNGGSGDNGGNLKLYCLDFIENRKNLTRISFTGNGGDVGSGGKVGRSGKGGDHHRTICGRRNPGSRGDDGNPGIQGRRGLDGHLTVECFNSFEDALKKHEESFK